MIALQTIQEELLVEYYDILKVIAVKYNTTVEAVYSEMQLSIDEAFQSTDPSVRQAWSRKWFHSWRQCLRYHKCSEGRTPGHF